LIAPNGKLLFGKPAVYFLTTARFRYRKCTQQKKSTIREEWRTRYENQPFLGCLGVGASVLPPERPSVVISYGLEEWDRLLGLAGCGNVLVFLPQCRSRFSSGWLSAIHAFTPSWIKLEGLSAKDYEGEKKAAARTHY
jgi:hypothetical protein